MPALGEGSGWCGSIGTTAQGLTTAATFLDDFNVNLLLRSTQASLN